MTDAFKSTDEKIDQSIGRRLADKWARYSTTFSALVTSALLGVIVMFYGNLPNDSRELKQQQAVIMVELSYIKEQNRDLLEQARSLQQWRERLSIVEQKQYNHTERFTEHDRRIDRLEQVTVGTAPPTTPLVRRR